MINRLFLPVSNTTIDSVLSESIIDSGDGDLDISLLQSSTFLSLSLHEIAAIYILNKLTELRNSSNPVIEKALYNFIAIGNESQSDRSLAKQLASRFSTLSIRKGREVAKNRDIFFLPDPDVKARDFLDSSGNWDYSFKTRYKHPDIQESVTITLPESEDQELFSSQHQIFRQIERSLSDEHVQIQGYAGTGKTHMLSAVSEILLSRQERGKTIIALTNSSAQLQALKKALHSDIRTMTFGQLASLIISKNVSGQTNNHLSRSVREHAPNPISELAQELKLNSIGPYSANRVSSILFQMVARYCWSREKSITREFLPKWVGTLSDEDAGYLVANAQLLWELVVNPPSNFPIKIPVRNYHAVKYVSLMELRIPDYFSHIIVDESHDLSEAMTDILERSTQGYTGLGDTFQSVNGYTSRRKVPVIEGSMKNSIRTPGRLEDVVNFSLQLHPQSVTDDFIANRQRTSQVIYYDRPEVPVKPSAIWVDDLWEMFEWAERLSAVGLPFRVLGSSTQLDQFVHGCIRLYRENRPAKVIALGRYNNWSSVMSQNGRHRSVKHINRLFERGYKADNWERTKKLQSESAKYVIGLFQNARNHEFDSVMLAPAIIHQLYNVKKSMASETRDAKMARSTLASRLYLGITRSRHTLILPQSFEEFMHLL